MAKTIDNTETVVRKCPFTGKLVLAVMDNGELLCLHNDDPEQDAKEVKEWLENNKYGKDN